MGVILTKWLNHFSLKPPGLHVKGSFSSALFPQEKQSCPPFIVSFLPWIIDTDMQNNAIRIFYYLDSSLRYNLNPIGESKAKFLREIEFVFLDKFKKNLLGAAQL